MEEDPKCKTCASRLRIRQNEHAPPYIYCSNQCVKCKGCYGFCECSKRRFEYKECKFCEEHVPIDEIKCDDCCGECRGECKNQCEKCGTLCDDECECMIKCSFCENEIRHFDYVNDTDYQCPDSAHNGYVYSTCPMCLDCGARWCWDNEGPCMKPCKECNGTCDSGCGCTCSKCGTETQQGGCKCYDEQYQQEKKNHHTMSFRFTNGQEIRHRIKTNEWVGVYVADTNTIQSNNSVFDSLSSFALAHYKSIQSNRKTVNGWKECEYKDGDSWKSTF